jgi:hypothetical protein
VKKTPRRPRPPKRRDDGGLPPLRGTVSGAIRVARIPGRHPGTNLAALPGANDQLCILAPPAGAVTQANRISAIPMGEVGRPLPVRPAAMPRWRCPRAGRRILGGSRGRPPPDFPSAVRWSAWFGRPDDGWGVPAVAGMDKALRVSIWACVTTADVRLCPGGYAASRVRYGLAAHDRGCSALRG